MVRLDRSAIARQLDTNFRRNNRGSTGSDRRFTRPCAIIQPERGVKLEQISDLDLLPTSNRNSSQTIPLSTVANISLVPDLTVICRRNGQRVNIVTVTFPYALTQLATKQRCNRILSTSTWLFLEIGGESKNGIRPYTILSTIGVLGVLTTATLLTFTFALAASIGAPPFFGRLGFGALWIFAIILWFYGNSCYNWFDWYCCQWTVVIANRKLMLCYATPRRWRKVAHATRHLIATTITDIAGFTPCF